NEVRAARRATCFGVIVRKRHAFSRQPVEVWRLPRHDSAMVGADVEPSHIVTHDDEDVWRPLLLLLLLDLLLLLLLLWLSLLPLLGGCRHARHHRGGNGRQQTEPDGPTHAVLLLSRLPKRGGSLGQIARLDYGWKPAETMQALWASERGMS